MAKYMWTSDDHTHMWTLPTVATKFYAHMDRMTLYDVALRFPLTGTKMPKLVPSWHCPCASVAHEDMVRVVQLE